MRIAHKQRSDRHQRFAAWPMYDYPELAAAHDALWAALARELRAAGVGGVPMRLARGRAVRDTWCDRNLLLGQGCEYPLAKTCAAHVRLVATPRYSAPGCDGATYRSAIVVRADDPARELRDLRRRRAVVNEWDSNSGMNLLRAAVAPLSGGLPFFDSVRLSGSHRRSAALVADGSADVAALDCVSLAHFRALYPQEVAGLRVLCWTDSSPSLPFITARETDAHTLEALRSGLRRLVDSTELAEVRARLLLSGVDVNPAQDYARVLALEVQACAAGYPVLR